MDYKKMTQGHTTISKKTVTQRQKHSQKSFFKFKKSKVNYVSLQYKNYTKTNTPLPARLFF
jgi:hypothetical protein